MAKNMTMMMDAAKSDKVNAKAKTTLLLVQEAIITKGQTAFLATAEAVLEIISKKLFAPHYKTPKDYFAARWDMTESDVSRYKKAGVLLGRLKLNGFVELPKNEGQCRALADVVGDERQLAVWDQAIKGGEKITAKLIDKLANPPKPISDDDDVASVALATGATTDAEPTRPPMQKIKCSIHIEFAESENQKFGGSAEVYFAALEFMGVPCQLSGNNCIVEVEATKREVLVQIAEWNVIDNVKRVSLAYHEPIMMMP